LLISSIPTVDGKCVLPGVDSPENVCFLSLTFDSGLHNLGCSLSWQAHDTISIGYDEVTGADNFVPQFDWGIYPTASPEILARASDAKAASKDWKPDISKKDGIAYAPVNDHPGKSPHLGGRGHDLTPISVVVNITNIDD
jgi:hypothetical protein